MIVIGANEAWQVADTLATANIKVVVDPVDNLPSSFESLGAGYDNIMILDTAGVDYAIANSWFGLPSEMVTTGDISNLVVWDGDPLEATSAPIKLWIDGEERSLVSRQTLLRDRYNPTSNETIPHKYR